jgi:hypothetical protein
MYWEIVSSLEMYWEIVSSLEMYWEICEFRGNVLGDV